MATSQSLKAQLCEIIVDSNDDAGSLMWKFAMDSIKSIEDLEQSPDEYTRAITVKDIAKGVEQALRFLRTRSLD